MPVLGRRPAVTVLSSGETVTVISEPAQYSIPAFTVKTADGSFYLNNTQILPLGSRVAYLLREKAVPTPVLCCYRDSQKGANPLFVSPLHNIVDPAIVYDGTLNRIHLFWWWNAWTPTEVLPQPTRDFYQSHSVPDSLTPAWLRSVVPKAQPGRFNPRKPFWVAPLPDGYGYDAYPGIIMGESRANGDNRIPDTPGARLLQDLVRRGLVQSPGPPEAPFGAIPEPAREDWERRGGIVAAGEHLRIASLRDGPEFVPDIIKNPYTKEIELASLPGVGDRLPGSTTWEDHLVIVNALKAHFDYANLINATRVLMGASGFLLDGSQWTTVPCQFSLGGSVRGPFWPDASETVTAPALLLEFPQVITSFPTVTNYRTVINPDKIWHPYLDYPDIGTVFVTDGYLGESATSHLKQHVACDWVLSDPVDPASQLLDYFRRHLDNRSY
jgi:hypothetical protein